MDPERGGGGGGTGVPDTPENSQKYRVPYQYWSGSSSNHLLPSLHSMSGHHRHASEMPFKWHFAGGSMMTCL